MHFGHIHHPDGLGTSIWVEAKIVVPDTLPGSFFRNSNPNRLFDYPQEMSLLFHLIPDLATSGL